MIDWRCGLSDRGGLSREFLSRVAISNRFLLAQGRFCPDPQPESVFSLAFWVGWWFGLFQVVWWVWIWDLEAGQRRSGVFGP